MIQYCIDVYYESFNTFTISSSFSVESAMKFTKSTEVFRKMHKLGYEFGEMGKWYNAYYSFRDDFEIIKFLRSISIPWSAHIMNDIVKYGTLEMIQFAHEDGCPWTGKEYNHLFREWSMDKFKYLIDNGCIVDYGYSYDLIRGLGGKKELVLLDYFVGKNSSFDNALFKHFLGWNPWFEGISFLLEKGKDVQNFKSLEEVFQKHKKIDGLKYFHSLGLPWCLDSSRQTHLLSKIACYNDLEDVKWAYENGCKGDNFVPYVKEEWKEYRGIRNTDQWKANRTFFEENELIDEVILEKGGIKKLDPKNVQEIGDAYRGSFFDVDFCSLKILVDYGYMFASESEKETLCKEAYKRCCMNSNNKEESRKRLALFVGMGVRDL